MFVDFCCILKEILWSMTTCLSIKGCRTPPHRCEQFFQQSQAIHHMFLSLQIYAVYFRRFYSILFTSNTGHSKLLITTVSRLMWISSLTRHALHHSACSNIAWTITCISNDLSWFSNTFTCTKSLGTLSSMQNHPQNSMKLKHVMPLEQNGDRTYQGNYHHLPNPDVLCAIEFRWTSIPPQTGLLPQKGDQHQLHYPVC